MLRAPNQQADLFLRINRWKQEVVKSTGQEASTRQSCSQKHEPHHMKLRSQDKRPALAQVSGNPYSRKRKAFVTMADTPVKKQSKKPGIDEGVEEVRGRSGRGRPRKDKPVDIDEDENQGQSAPRRQGRSGHNVESASSRELSLRLRTDIKLPPPQQPRYGSASPSKSSKSPSKRGQITIGNPIPESSIDMAYLRRCDPSVRLTTFFTLREVHMRIPSPVEDLFGKLLNIPAGPIPFALRDKYEQDANTPRKRKEPYSQSSFLEPNKTPFPDNCLDRMKSTANNVWRKAYRAHARNAHEDEWGALVNQLLCEVEIWQEEPEQIIVLNVETCAIQPEEIRPKRPSPHGNLPIDCDDQSVTSSSKTPVTKDGKTRIPPESVGRMIDWCLALEVDFHDDEVIQQAFAKQHDYLCSLNQTFSPVKNNPLILDIEIKKTLQSRDPQVQLAIWASAALLKKRLMRWDTSLPMPAVAINGHSWELYIFFEMDKNLMMAGPYEFGTTKSVAGIWEIFYRLHVIMRWGMTTYKDWFKAHVVAWAQRVVDEEEGEE